MFVDLDDFKGVNDTLGHEAGDGCSGRSRACESAERCAPRAALARFGGDEFIVVLEDPSIARRPPGRGTWPRPCSRRVEGPFPARRPRDPGGGSLGLALYPVDADHGGAAEERRTRCTRPRRGRRTLALRRRTSTRGGAPHAARERRTCAAPGSGTSWSWPTSRSSPLPSDEAAAPRRCCAGSIPSAGSCCPPIHRGRRGERPGRAARQVGARSACGRRRAVALAPTTTPHVRSTSRRASCATPRVRRADTQAHPRAHRMRAGLARGFEITETRDGARRRGRQPHARQVRALGVRIEIDDFGTGFSSLVEHLRHLPVDALKIDRAFLRGVPDDGRAAAIVTAIVAARPGARADRRRRGRRARRPARVPRRATTARSRRASISRGRCRRTR